MLKIFFETRVGTSDMISPPHMLEKVIMLITIFRKMKVSVYSSLFNVDNGMFDVPAALENWGKYADEIVIATMFGST